MTIERVRYDRDLRRIESHQPAGNGVNRGRIRPSNQDAGCHSIGCCGAVPLAPNDSIDDCQISLPRSTISPGTVRIAVQKGSVEVQSHAPASIVARPVAIADNHLAVTQNVLTKTSHHPEEPGSDDGNCERDSPTNCLRLSLEDVRESIVRELIPTNLGRSFPMMWQPVLIAVDSNQVLKTTGDPCLLM